MVIEQKRCWACRELIKNCRCKMAGIGLVATWFAMVIIGWLLFIMSIYACYKLIVHFMG